MAKRKDTTRAAKLFSDLITLAAPSPTLDPGVWRDQPHGLKRMGKFRFQLLHEWLVANFKPCRVADIGGGKGLLAYLLQQSGWDATVIDPLNQALPDKYKDLITDQRVRIAPTASVRHLDCKFESRMTDEFDVLVGMHAHGCNVKIIDGAFAFKRSFVLIPCCIIDEPVYPPHGIRWQQCLLNYALSKQRGVLPFQLNFSGQNIGFYSRGMGV